MNLQIALPAVFGSLILVSAANYRTNQILQELAIDQDDRDLIKIIVVQNTMTNIFFLGFGYWIAKF